MTDVNQKKIDQNQPFFTSVKELRDRARHHMKQGAITPSYEVDLPIAIKILNEALATELVCVLRYKRHYFTADGIHASAVKAEFLQHIQEEQIHADRIAERIQQLGGSPDFNPETLLTRSHADYKEGTTLIDMIEEDLIAERVAVDSYREMIQFFGDRDSTTRRMLEDILAQEEEHAEDMAGFLVSLQH